MKIWLIKQTTVRGYGTYDSAVVAALTEDDAKNMHPAGGVISDDKPFISTEWTRIASDVTATLIGQAIGIATPRVICASYIDG